MLKSKTKRTGAASSIPDGDVSRGGRDLGVARLVAIHGVHDDAATEAGPAEHRSQGGVQRPLQVLGGAWGGDAQRPVENVPAGKPRVAGKLQQRATR